MCAPPPSKHNTSDMGGPRPGGSQHRQIAFHMASHTCLTHPFGVMTWLHRCLSRLKRYRSLLTYTLPLSIALYSPPNRMISVPRCRGQQSRHHTEPAVTAQHQQPWQPYTAVGSHAQPQLCVPTATAQHQQPQSVTAQPQSVTKQTDNSQGIKCDVNWIRRQEHKKLCHASPRAFTSVLWSSQTLLRGVTCAQAAFLSHMCDAVTSLTHYWCVTASQTCVVCGGLSHITVVWWPLTRVTHLCDVWHKGCIDPG